MPLALSGTSTPVPMGYIQVLNTINNVCSIVMIKYELCTNQKTLNIFFVTISSVIWWTVSNGMLYMDWTVLPYTFLRLECNLRFLMG